MPSVCNILLFASSDIWEEVKPSTIPGQSVILRIAKKIWSKLQLNLFWIPTTRGYIYSVLPPISNIVVSADTETSGPPTAGSAQRGRCQRKKTRQIGHGRTHQNTCCLLWAQRTFSWNWLLTVGQTASQTRRALYNAWNKSSSIHLNALCR